MPDKESFERRLSAGDLEREIWNEVRVRILADPRYQALLAEDEALEQRVLYGDPKAKPVRGLIDA